MGYRLQGYEFARKVEDEAMGLACTRFALQLILHGSSFCPVYSLFAFLISVANFYC